MVVNQPNTNTNPKTTRPTQQNDKGRTKRKID